jgi:hypothetical protein
MGTGVVTSLLISGLLAFSNYLSQMRSRTSRNSPPRNTFAQDRRTPYPASPGPTKQDINPDRPRGNRETQPASGYQTEYGTPTAYNAQTFQQDVRPPNSGNATSSAQAGTSAAADDEDDWVSEPSKIVDRPPVNDVLEANPRDYEAKQEPKSQSWSGSVYSYGYRDPSKSGVGQTESVYDADYRVIVPPQGVPISDIGDGEVAPHNTEDEEDWGLDEDDELEDDRPSGGPINLKK